jgi:hypothetical protein
MKEGKKRSKRSNKKWNSERKNFQILDTKRTLLTICGKNLKLKMGGALRKLGDLLTVMLKVRLTSKNSRLG